MFPIEKGMIKAVVFADLGVETVSRWALQRQPGMFVRSRLSTWQCDGFVV
jgi:hypothetical protein